MSARAEYRLIVLMPQELRTAAKLLVAARVEGLSDDESGAAIVDALKACSVALAGVQDDDTVLVVGAQ